RPRPYLDQRPRSGGLALRQPAKLTPRGRFILHVCASHEEAMGTDRARQNRELDETLDELAETYTAVICPHCSRVQARDATTTICEFCDEHMSTEADDA